MKFLHVTIQVKNMDSSLEFYQNIVGLSIRRDMRNIPGHSIVFMSDKEGDTQVELIETPQNGCSYSGSGISIGFKTDDIHADHKKLQALSLSPGEIISPVPGTYFFFFKDPDGLTLQFVQE